MPILLYIGSNILAHESPGHLDFFGAHHTNREPVVLCDGTSVRWPAHYSKADAKLWREHRRLVKPSKKKSRHG